MRTLGTICHLKFLSLEEETYMTDELLQRIAECKIVPVVKIDDVADTLPLMKALAEGGIMSAEITFRTACGPDALALAAKSCPEMLVGAGTVINKEQAEKAVACGAKFIVGPGFSKEVADVCRKADVLYLPGVVTPTEAPKPARSTPIFLVPAFGFLYTGNSVLLIIPNSISSSRITPSISC